MIDESMIEKMFDSVYGDSIDKDTWTYEMIKNGFKNAINLLLPIIQKQNKAIEFYADASSWEGREIDGCDWDDFYEDGSGIGGKLARQVIYRNKEVLEKVSAN